MRNNFWNKRIPTLFGLLVISLAIVGTTFLVGQRTFFTQEAAPSSDPMEIRITNVTDSSFTVSYYTNSSVPGSLNFGKGSLTQTIVDDKDKNAIVEHKTHSFTVKNLTPLTKYSFIIVSGQNTYQNNGVPYQIETAPTIDAKPSTGFLIGKLTTQTGSIPKEGIIYLTSLGSAPLSTVMKSDGSYTISFENLRTESLDSYFQLKSSSELKLLVITDSGTSKLTVSAKDIVNVPTIVVSKDYDFTQAESVATSSATTEEFPDIAKTKSLSTPKITSPLEDQNLTTTQPTFKGTGIPNDKIKITIQSPEEIQGEVIVDSRGNWTFKPSTPLSPGEHTITITARDSTGILRTITQTFTIQAAEAAVVPSSATPSPTPSATPIATVSATPSATPIAIPTPTPITIETPVPTLPPTGSSQVSTGIMGIALAVIGAAFFVLSRILL